MLTILKEKICQHFFGKKIDKNDLLTDCKNFLGLNFRDKLYGDDKREVILTEVSQLLREMLHYMKQRVDADISGENTQKNASDYSRPKMVMVSGHDTTLTSLETYKLNSYASQIAVEVARDDNKDIKKLKYSDYKALFYFNDLLVIDEQLDKFIDTIEKSILSKEEIDNFCFGGKGNEMINIYLIIIIAISLFATIHNRIHRPKDVTGKVNDKHDKISNELRNYNPSDNLYHDYVILYFEDCKGITSVNLSSCTTIGDYAFNECSNLTSVTFGSNITTIGEAAFNDCGAATTFYFYSSPHTVTYGNLDKIYEYLFLFY